MRQFLKELRRRKVYRVGMAYVVVAFVVLQLAELAAGAFGLPEWFEPMVWVVCGLGFPLALVLAWAFDVTPEGVRRTAPAEHDEEVEAGRPGLPLAANGLVALGILSAAAAGGWYLMGSGGENPEADAVSDERSIAVLPFDNLSGTEEAQPFVNGIHDDLLTRLSNISELKVISRTSVLPYRDTELSLPAIADSLGVTWIVEGGVQQAGDQVQVNAQLIQAEEDAHQWAQTYRRELSPENLFAIQGELTKEIARSLEAELTPQETERVERQPTGDLEAYRLYVQGRTHLDRRTEEGMRQGLELFEEAIRRDSAYALAWSGLADARSLLAFYGYAEPEEMYPAAMDAARRSVELAPELAEAHASLGHLHHNPEPTPNPAAALRELERAVELKPSYAQAQVWLAQLEGALGRPHRMLRRAQVAAELDPRSPLNQAVLSSAYWWVEGPGERALRHTRRAETLEPGYAVAHVQEGGILLDAGRHDEAIAAIRRGLEHSTAGTLGRALGLGALGAMYAGVGDTARARESLLRLEEEESPLFEAMIHAALGEEAAAFRALGEGEGSWRLFDLTALRYWPVYDVLRDDPRYGELLQRIHQRMGLNPDGSLPDSADVEFDIDR